MKIGKVRVHLRHIGTGPKRRPGISRGIKRDPYFANIYLGGRLCLAIRPVRGDGNLVRKLIGQNEKPKFFDLGMGRAMLRYQREEQACPWPGTDHYYGVCNCPNKRPTHPSYL